MNIWYFKEKIPDELEGAKDYIKRAIEIRAMHAPWAKQLVDMSEKELEHATTLYKMFQEYYAKLDAEFKELPDYVKDARTMLDEKYTKCSAEIKNLHEIYRM